MFRKSPTALLSLLVVVLMGVGTLTASAAAGKKPKPKPTTRGYGAPTVTINQSQDQVDPTTTAPVRFTVKFSERVWGFNPGDVAISGTAGGTKSVSVSSRDNATFTVSVSGMTTSGTVVATVPAGGVRDDSGNRNTASTSSDNSVSWGTGGAGAPPPPPPPPPPAALNVTVNQASGQLDPTTTATAHFTTQFSAPVTRFDTSDVAIGGTASRSTVSIADSGDHQRFDVSVVLLSSGTVTAAVPAGLVTDAGGTANTASTSSDNTITYNSPAAPPPAPSVTVNQASSQTDPTSVAIVHFAAQFSAPVAGFDASDVTFGGTATRSTSTVTDSGDHQLYDVSVTLTSGGTVTAVVAAGSALNAGGVANTASTSTDNTVTYTPSASPPPSNRINLTAQFGTNLAQAMAWLAANKQPAIVTAGTYRTSGVIDIPAGVDLVFDNATIIPTTPSASALRLRGAGTKLSFTGTCRIGAAGTTNTRLGNAEAAGIELEGASGFTISADNLTIEGVAQDAIFFYRGSHDGVISGTITAVDTGADSFHVTDRSYNMDFQAKMTSIGSGDDGFAVVSYLENGTPVKNVHWHDVTVLNQKNGRGVSVVGGQNVTVDHYDVNGSAGAGVYIAAEPQYNTFGVDSVTMSGRVRNPNTEGIHNANVVVYSAQSGQTITHVNVTVDPDPAWAVVQKTGAYPISNVFVNGSAVS